MENSGKYFESNFSDDYNSKLLNLSDGVLRTEDGHAFPIHKYTLAKSSEYFYSTFCDFGEKKYDILIPGMKGEDLSNILSFLYTGNIHVTEGNICNLMIASDYLLLDDLLSKIKSSLNRILTFTNCVSILKNALQIKRDDFSRKSYRFVQAHFESIVYCGTSEIYELPLDTFKLLLGDKSLCVRSERTVWLAVVTWVEADNLNRLSWVPDLLTYLAISDIDENIASEILQHGIVAKNPCCQEILDIKSYLYNADNVNILQYYFQTHTTPIFNSRQPTKLHYFARHTRNDNKKGIQVYLTYDEHMDLWRRILDIDFSLEILLSLNDCIYMFEMNGGRKLRYNVVGKQLSEMGNFIQRRKVHTNGVVELDGLLYALGGDVDATATLFRLMYNVEYYDPEIDEWYETTPMLPVSNLSAVVYNHFIYEIGSRLVYFGHHEMIAQVYDPCSETWNILPTPSLIRYGFAMVVYRDMIFVIGGSSFDDVDENEDTDEDDGDDEGDDGDEADDEEVVKRVDVKSVEVFDLIKNEWSTKVDIPYIYGFPKAIVLNDKLIVYDDVTSNHCNPAVQWNSEKKDWEPFEESSPMNSLGMYYLSTLEDSDNIHIISSENKDLAMHFEHSPFA